MKIYKVATLATLVLAGFVTAFSFQSWNLREGKPITMEPVNDELRLAHAKELLGASLRQHRAAAVNITGDLSQYLLREVQGRLPKSYGDIAPTVAQVLIRESQAHYLDPIFVLALIETESKFNPLARGRHGEIGLMQIKPSTARWISKKYRFQFNGEKSLLNPIQNIRIGIAYIHFLRQNFKGSAAQYVNAYNVGPKKLRQLLAEDIRPSLYSIKVIGNYLDFYRDFSEGV